LSDFESVEDFLARGIGYGVMQNDTMIGVAYSSLICSKGIEVSIFVSPEHRRQGIATVLASYLLKWSLAHNLDPHWDAANPESCKLAEKLGYLPTGTYTAYYLQS
jgi:predicted GNAT family acetyltransferase